MAKIIDGNKIAKSIRSKVRLRVKTLIRPPGLAVIQLGQDPASTVYVNHKIKDCHRVNFHSEVHRLSENVSQNRVLELVDRLNNLQKIDGILLQMPTPDHIDGQAIIDTILPTKDVDGLSSANQGGLLIGRHQVTPCTPTGIIRLLDEIGLDIAGKKAVCIGRSTLVGKPVGLLLMERNATVTYCHSKTENLATETRQADILISAVGRPRMITSPRSCRTASELCSSEPFSLMFAMVTTVVTGQRLGLSMIRRSFTFQSRIRSLRRRLRRPGASVNEQLGLQSGQSKATV